MSNHQEEFINSLLKSAIKDINPNYRAHIADFIKWIGNKNIDAQTIVDYFRDLNESRRYAAATVRIKRAAIKNLLRKIRVVDFYGSPFFPNLDQFLYDIDREPATRAPKIDSNTVDADRVLTREEILQLLNGTKSERLRLFIRFLFATGCRVSELTGIRLHDCEDRADAVRIRILGKGRKERFVRIPATMYAEIRLAFAGESWLFETSGGKPHRRTYVSDAIAALGRRVLGRKISAHVLRHSFAMTHINAGHDLSQVSRTLGHSGIGITHELYKSQQLPEDLLRMTNI